MFKDVQEKILPWFAYVIQTCWTKSYLGLPMLNKHWTKSYLGFTMFNRCVGQDPTLVYLCYIGLQDTFTLRFALVIQTRRTYSILGLPWLYTPVGHLHSQVGLCYIDPQDTFICRFSLVIHSYIQDTITPRLDLVIMD